MPTLSFHRLTKTYGALTVLDDFTATALPGRVTAFLGVNGAGKTTSMRIMLGLSDPTSGTATVDGIRYRDLPHPTRVVGAVLDQGFHPNRTARHHIRLTAVQAGGTVFLSSHLLGEVAAVADDLVVIHHGRLAAAGPVDDIVTPDTDLESAFHHLIGSNDAQQAWS